MIEQSFLFEGINLSSVRDREKTLTTAAPMLHAL